MTIFSSIMDDLKEQIRLHTAGATVRHKSSFANMIAFNNKEELTQDFIDNWAVPYYFNIGVIDENWVLQLIEVKEKITREIALKLLGDFDWRTRQTGSFFAVIKNYTDLTDIIGTHFLKSEVCFAGQTYAYSFASFNSDKSVDYLNRYLTYYLSKPDLWFDQQYAMEALTYLDRINGTDHTLKHSDSWLKFLKNKPNWDRKIKTDRLEEWLEQVETVKSY